MIKAVETYLLSGVRLVLLSATRSICSAATLVLPVSGRRRLFVLRRRSSGPAIAGRLLNGILGTRPSTILPSTFAWRSRGTNCHRRTISVTENRAVFRTSTLQPTSNG